MKKAIALLWTLIIILVLLIISGTMASYMIKESRMGINIEDSSKAYAFAKSGIEWGVINKGEAVGPTCFDLDISVTGVEDVCVMVDVPNGDGTKITSTGKANNVVRKIEYIIQDNNAEKITPSDIVNNTIISPSVSGSFDFQFDFWADNATFSGNSVFGLDTLPGSTNPSLYIKFGSDGKISLNRKDSSGNEETYGKLSIPLTSDATLINKYAEYRLKIKYVHDNSISLKLYQFDNIDKHLCVDYVSSSPDINFSTLASFYTNSSGVSYENQTSVTIGDGTFIKITDSVTNNIYIDNIYLTRYPGTGLASGGSVITIPVLTFPPPAEGKYFIAAYVSGGSSDNTTFGSNTVSGNLGSWTYIAVDKNINLSITANAGLNSVFSHWENDCASFNNNLNCTISMDRDKSFIAYFDETVSSVNHLVSIVTSGQGEVTADGITCGSVNTDCDELYGEGSSVVLTATPVAGNIFSSWGGDCSGNESICTITNITSAKNITANFAPAEYISLDIEIKEQGTVTVDGTSLICNPPSCHLSIVKGSNVVLKATPATNYYFFRWKMGPCDGLSESTCYLGIMNYGLYMKAEFKN